MRDWLRGFIGGLIIAFILSNIGFLLIKILDIITETEPPTPYILVIIAGLTAYIIVVLSVSIDKSGRDYFKSFPKFKE